MVKLILLGWVRKIMTVYLMDLPIDWDIYVNKHENLLTAIRNVRTALRELEDQISATDFSE